LAAPAFGAGGVFELPLEPEPMFGQACFPVEPVPGGWVFCVEDDVLGVVVVVGVADWVVVDCVVVVAALLVVPVAAAAPDMPARAPAPASAPATIVAPSILFTFMG